MSRYIDPKTDFGFKRLFAQEDSKDILKQFLFDVLKLAHPIEELTYIPNEQLPQGADERIGVYDVYCKDILGQRFVVEMQRGSQTFIRDRVLYYSTFPIIHQAKKGTTWAFELIPIYCIAILNFAIDEGKEYLRRVQLMDIKAKSVFYDKLTYVYIELPKFGKEPGELTEAVDKWVYLLKYMPELQDIPAELANEPFTHAFEIAESAALSPKERILYEASLKSARDAYAEIVSARQKGWEEGMEKGKEEGREEGREEGLSEGRRLQTEALARTMAERGLAIALIAEMTGLTEAQIKQLRSSTEMSNQ
ncbi:MAG: Rpn family recombination-promoting nuclease/putative transposase [Caldilinea sp. CFX5]|nr:Rpn family recombination-promoting nuclease/putative transposase [Caldilinea sp. CFX5]